MNYLLILSFSQLSQILAIKVTGYAIKRNTKEISLTNITAIKYFEKAKEEDFTQYGSAAKIFICCF
jgi:hypothetical protein